MKKPLKHPHAPKAKKCDKTLPFPIKRIDD